MNNAYMPFKSEILKIHKHTDIEYTFTMAYNGEKNVKPGQFFEISIPKYGECPISVSGIREGELDFTIRRVGKVTDELHKFQVGGSFWMRGPYGNGFDVDLYKGKEVIIAAGGSGLAPVKGIVDYINENTEEFVDFNLLCGFKSPSDILFKEEIKTWEEKLKVTLTVDGAEEGYKGNVGLITKYVEGVKVADKSNTAVIIVGPPLMMKFTVMSFIEAGIPEENIWVSYERKMHCGIGKCGHCKMDDTYICLEGPVFNFTKAKQLFD